MQRQVKIAFFALTSEKKTGINYPHLEPGNEFRNRVRVPGFCCKSLVVLSEACCGIQHLILQLVSTAIQLPGSDAK